MSYVRRLLAILVALFVLAPAIAGAQGAPLTVQQARLSLWPEYDDPGLLIILNGSFAVSGQWAEQPVKFPLPANARNVQATVQQDTNLLTVPWERQGESLVYTLPGPAFHVEYYVDLDRTANERVIQYNFPAPYDMQRLDVEIQQPARATGFSVTPAATAAGPSQDGVTYYRLTREGVKAGENIAITVKYTKTDQGLSASAAQAATPVVAGAVPSSTRSATDPLTLVAWVLVGAGAAALAGVAVYWYVTRRQTAPVTTNRPQPRSERGNDRRSKRGSGGSAGFCPACGTAYRVDDRFCAQCGAARRT